MPSFDAITLKGHLGAASDLSNSTAVRGRAYEDALEHVFASVPGCEVQRNSLNLFRSEEVDLSVLNFRDVDGFRALPEVFLVECKNWSAAVDSATVNEFVAKVRHRGCTLGVLVAANGVTGDPHQKTAAYQSAAFALSEGVRLLLLTTSDFSALTCSAEITKLLHRRFLDLFAAGTFTIA